MNTQKLRDMNLHAVADELEQLREFKAEIESQKPIFYSVHRKEHEPSNAVCFNDIEVANKYVSNNYDLCVSALYVKPVPADTAPEAIKLLQRVAEKTTEKDPFEAERLAIKFCEQRGLEDRSKMYRLAIDAFTVAYRMRPTSSEHAAAPADKPSVAVPDEWRRIVERAANMMRMSGVVSHKDSLNPLHSWLHDAESLLDAPSHSQQSALEPVEGDLLPPVGTNVAIHLAYNDKWVNHKVVGYYVWGPLGGVSDSYSRVFVRVVDGCGFQNARLLKDIKWDRCPSHESEQGGNNDV